jgi:hypothetical protein
MAAVSKTFVPEHNLLPNRRIHSNGLVSSMLAVAYPAILTHLFASNPTNHKLYVQVFDASATPTPGSIPLISIPLEAHTAFALDTPVPGMESGVFIGLSSTFETFTASAELIQLMALLRD